MSPLIEDAGAYARLRPVVPGARFFSKTCTRCGETKPLDQFHRNKRGALGRQADCIECAKSGARRGIDPRTVEKETDESLAIIQSRFELDASGQVIYREDSGGGHRKAGEVAGTLRPDGYRRIGITLAPGLHRHFQAHRVAHALANGRWPAPHEQVDHVDHRTQSTDPSRLRTVGHGANQHNQHGARADSASGVRGVSWRPDVRKWRASIRVDGRTRHLGYFESKVEAGLAYASAKLQQQVAVPIVTCARIACDALGVPHEGLDRPHVLGAFLIAYRRHRAAQ